MGATKPGHLAPRFAVIPHPLPVNLKSGGVNLTTVPGKIMVYTFWPVIFVNT
jgi:hypothetical protein